MSDTAVFACSALNETDGLPYFPRLCDKIRLMEAGNLHPDLQGNLGVGMDLWTCQFLGVEYADLKAQIIAGASDEEAMAWAKENGITRPEFEKEWFISYLKNRGFRDDMSARLAERKKESAHTDRDDIHSFMDYIEIDEGRTL